MKFRSLIPILPILLLSLSSPLFAEDDETAKAAKAHLRSIMSYDFDNLEKTYAKSVVLMPGHEFLQLQYGLTEEKGRKKALTVERDKLIAAMRKSAEARSPRPVEKIDAMINSLTCKALDAAPGDFKTTPSDAVGTPDGKLHFTIVKGDVLLKIAPPRGDAALFQLRQIDGAWRIVAEYFD